MGRSHKRFFKLQANKIVLNDCLIPFFSALESNAIGSLPDGVFDKLTKLVFLWVKRPLINFPWNDKEIKTLDSILCRQKKSWNTRRLSSSGLFWESAEERKKTCKGKVKLVLKCSISSQLKRQKICRERRYDIKNNPSVTESLSGFLNYYII